jgi:hypothetical protein
MLGGKLIISLVATIAVATGAAYTAVSLSRSSIERFLSSLEVLQGSEVGTQLESSGNEPEQDLEESGVSLPFTSLVSALPEGMQREAFNRIIQEHGFEDAQEWAATGDKLVRVMVVTESPNEYEDLQVAISRMIGDLEADTILSELERSEARQRLIRQEQLAKALEPTMTEAFLARPYIARFEAILESNIDAL